MEWADHRQIHQDFGAKLSVTSGGDIRLLRMVKW